MERKSDKKVESIEIALLLEAIYQKYHYDFKEYSRAHLKRRIMHRIKVDGLKSISHMQHKVLYEPAFFEKLLQDFSINVTEMFRDPPFFLTLRRDVLPLLAPLSHIKIWHAGCASGEEAYSMAIILEEEGLLEKSQIYATDFNTSMLNKAKEGIYILKDIENYEINYRKAGGKKTLAHYYTAKYDSVIFNTALKEKIVFADHNLVTDSVFGEMSLILCRNVLIYFTKPLQNNVAKLFSDSVAPAGFLCLGAKESLRFSKYIDKFEIFNIRKKIYRKKKEKEN
ncbi:MAG: protein-glutamate O-methyltransferase CheR [bacterium]|nr:protein-glutamate O-methyltransferase CheR [bacterium]